MTTLDWLENHAGPLILLPSALLTEWSGIDVPEYRTVSAEFRWNLEEHRACDYDRACDVNDYVGAIPVGYGEGLILNDEPGPTAWLARDWGGMFARWEYAEGDRSMEAALAAIPQDIAWAAKGDFTIVGSPQELFNSAEPGVESVRPRLELALREGRYNVRWARHQPNPLTSVGLIELRRSDAS